jgi:monofunctional biosynthetic peptidoglycan transglycosylase
MEMAALIDDRRMLELYVNYAQNRVPAHLDRLGFQPVEDAGVEGLASEQEPSDDDCSTPPEEITELIAAEGTG